MYPAVKEVLPRDDYTLTVVFENGEKGVLDMKPMLDFGVFQVLKDYDIFKRVLLPSIRLNGNAASILTRSLFTRSAYVDACQYRER